MDKLFETFRDYANKHENRYKLLYLHIESDGSGALVEEKSEPGECELEWILYFSNADEGIQAIKELK